MSRSAFLPYDSLIIVTLCVMAAIYFGIYQTPDHEKPNRDSLALPNHDNIAIGRAATVYGACSIALGDATVAIGDHILAVGSARRSIYYIGPDFERLINDYIEMVRVEDTEIDQGLAGKRGINIARWNGACGRLIRWR
jgi:hypothetical protein